ncbi:tRNA lysidine(34) synthetase TilS [secondary endosymbiont of Ctenarytaina eucalypti]|uniref:tRNA(Ile)-lysidine synthase n=1 Tax=secondary endosymbiont of Ctenarytaina eucalypti TaxID=1199245 RepID=J3Z2V2_9ENTR|nr:tRNA lysidine(34) synthetase TilS [secondary endosymbiont of Ctenarytaina eucalypti]AFP84534.1 tRNA(Ile)-lysidine synthetase [secondary endosymbiont of Ctenarytaina eucalypti]
MKLNIGWQFQVLSDRVAARLAPYRALLLAFSGGLDSTVLLDILSALRENEKTLNRKDALSIRAVHIHHGLNRYADYWAAHCAHECRRRDVKFTIARVTTVDMKPDGIEAAARGARYRALALTLADNEALLTAQHQDDQAETLLLALKRGSGPAGLAGIAEDASFCGQRLVRPLLECARVDLERYARARGLRWIEDDSNTNLRFDRNFLRHQILPNLRHRWPKFSSAAARSARLCAEQERLLDEVLAKTLKELIHPDGSLRLRALITMSDLRRAAILRRWLASRDVRMPSRHKLTCLWEEVALSRRDSVAKMQLDYQQVRRFRDRLYVIPILPQISDGVTILHWLTENEELKLPGGLGMLLRRLMHTNKVSICKPIILLPKCDDSLGVRLNSHEAIPPINDNVAISSTIATDGMIAACKVVIVRAPLPDERVEVRFGPVRGLLYIIGRQRGRELKKIWQELDIPPWKRARTPLLFYNNQLIAALGVFVTRSGAARASEAQWHIFWCEQQRERNEQPCRASG